VRGQLPSPLDPPPGCAFHPRCPYAIARCREAVPPLEAIGEGLLVACIRANEIALAGSLPDVENAEALRMGQGEDARRVKP